MAGIKKIDMKVIKLKGDLVKKKPIIIMSISGGKDSLAMWLKMWEKRYQNLVAVHFDGGWEWPFARKEIRRVEKITGIKCYYLNHVGAFDEIFRKRGWPSWQVRWCTGYKRDCLRKFYSSIVRGHPEFEVKEAVGIAADEGSRARKSGMRKKRLILPLVDMKIKEREALRICGRYGCDWEGHYMRHDRMSCWCCPWQKAADWRGIFLYHRDRWDKMREMDRIAPKGRKFHWAGKYLWQMEKRLKSLTKDSMLIGG